ncbi:MAG: hypothetical protein ACT4OS_03850 [Acidimicrobiales bacterium]
MLTVVADRQVRDLRGRRRAAALRTIGELEDRGCDAAGYRLAGQGLDHICCRHLYGDDRLLTVWPSDESALVILVAPHHDTAGGVYDQLVEALDIDIPADEREKPPCCDEEGEPPTDADAASAIADAVERRARQQRRRR